MNQKTLVQLFTQLVKIDSPSGKEQQVADYINHYLSPRGFMMSVDGIGNLLARRPGKGVPCFFCAHMDTVEPGRTVKPVETKGRWYSGGSTILGADNKAAIAAILSGIDQYLTRDIAHRPLELLFTVKEEAGDGLTYFDFSQIASPFGIIFDLAQPIGRIVVASPYIINFTINLIGKSSHVSATKKSLPVLPAVLKLIPALSTTGDSENALVTIGKVSAGDNYNSIPGQAMICGEIRAYSQNDLKQAQFSVDNIITRITQAFDLKSAVSWHGYSPGYNHADNSLVLRTASSAVRSQGLRPKLIKTLSVSDANVLNEAGIPTVVLSDGVRNAHAINESIATNDLMRIETLVLSFLGYR